MTARYEYLGCVAGTRQRLSYATCLEVVLLVSVMTALVLGAAIAAMTLWMLGQSVLLTLQRCAYGTWRRYFVPRKR